MSTAIDKGWGLSRLNDLLRQLRADNPALADDLKREFDALAGRRSFGLNFERHVPEAVELAGRTVRKGDKVRVLPPRGEARTAENDRLWRVAGITRSDKERTADLVSLGDVEDELTVDVEDLVVVAEFRDPIYPGLVSTGKVEHGGDKPYHTVINAENFHALQTLLFTHRGKVDCIYIDPPYNTGARDWKYNNDYVESDDHYRHSKWLAFMERRLQLSKELLNPIASALIITIDEKELARLRLLLDQMFPFGEIQVISSVINPKGVVRDNQFSRTDEYVIFVVIGSLRLSGEPQDSTAGQEVPWQQFRRTDIASRRGTKKGGPNQFYPLFVHRETHRIEGIGEPLGADQPRESVSAPAGCVAVFPVRNDGTEMNWGLIPDSAERLLERGFLRARNHRPERPQEFTVQYLTSGRVRDVDEGRANIEGHDTAGAAIVRYRADAAQRKMATTAWNRRSHNAQYYGTALLEQLLPGRSFPFPKSLYAVEDALRSVIESLPDAVVLDYFAGSGTTAHAVSRLNKQDGGARQCIMVTNNEVGAEQSALLLAEGLRPGDTRWEQHGICDQITKPRMEAAISGKTPQGDPVGGDYKFTDEFPMAEGFEENAEFFTLTYEAPLRVSSHREFERIAPLLWLRAGSCGRRIEDISDGWDIADTYGVLADFDQSEPFLNAIDEGGHVSMAFLVTDEDDLFEAIVDALPDHVEPVRLYESYLRNFEIEAGRAAR